MLFCRGKCMLVILQRRLCPAPRTCSSIWCEERVSTLLWQLPRLPYHVPAISFSPELRRVEQRIQNARNGLETGHGLTSLILPSGCWSGWRDGILCNYMFTNYMYPLNIIKLHLMFKSYSTKYRKKRTVSSLTNRARGAYCGILAQCRDHTDQAQRDCPYKKTIEGQYSPVQLEAWHWRVSLI